MNRKVSIKWINISMRLIIRGKMTFDKQVEEAKKKKLQSRILRDLVFIILGIIFLAISIVVAVINKDDENTVNEEINTTNTVTEND